MGCVVGKTSHSDSETESTISTVSYRRKSVPYDDYWPKHQVKEEKDIQAELEGKNVFYPDEIYPADDKVPLSEKEHSEVSFNKEREARPKAAKGKKVQRTDTVYTKNGGRLSANKVEPYNKADIKHQRAQGGVIDKKQKNKNSISSRPSSVQTAHKEEIKDNEKLVENTTLNKADNTSKQQEGSIDKTEEQTEQLKPSNNKEPDIQQTDTDGKDTIDGASKELQDNQEDASVAKSTSLNSELDIDKMGNNESKSDHTSNTANGTNGHIEMPPSNGNHHVEEQYDDHHVHWKDERKVKISTSKVSLKDQEFRLMPTPSERVMSAHTRRGSAKYSAGRERRMSQRLSARKERRPGSTRLSASRERRRGSRGLSADPRMSSSRSSARGRRGEGPDEEGMDSYADVEQMIRDESVKEEDEEDIDSFDSDDVSSSQMTDRAPSLSLWYDDNVPGDIITTQVYVPSFGLTKHTYYCCLQWNSGKNGGGYCGLQDHANGRNYIFSIWDPIDGEGKIKPVYIGPGTTCEAFGGEGTGLKSWNFDLGWEPDCWYTLVTRRWDHDGHTRYGLWVKHHLECFWTHIVTVDFPLPGIYYDTWTCSFIEDWEGTGHRARRAHMRNGFKRKPNGQWVPFDKAVLGMVKEVSSRRYRGNFDAGNFDEMFFLQAGGETMPTEGVSEGSCFYTIADDKPTEVPISCVLTTVTGSEMVWEVSEGSVPQFRYAIKVDGQLVKQEINSEMRVCTFDSPPQKLVEIYVEDILGRTANAKFVVREKLQLKTNAVESER